MVKPPLCSKIPILLLGALMVGCSSPSPQTSGPDVVVVPTAVEDHKIVKRPVKPRPASKPRPKPQPKPPASASSEVNVPPPAAAGSPQTQPPSASDGPSPLLPIATFVTAGQLESAASGQLVFAGNNASAQEDQGLFEDAILLSRVRAGLAVVAESNLASTAKVSSGTVILDVPSNFEPKTIGAAIDTALNTSGVRKVQVIMTSN